MCGALKPDGMPCTRAAGWGTVHRGVGQCKAHGGKLTVQNKDVIAPAMLELLVGYDIGYVDPLEAMMMCIRISAAEVTFFSEQVKTLTMEDVLERPRAQTVHGAVESVVYDLKGQQQLNIWIRERQRSVDRLARFSKMAIDCGIAERQVRIAEQMGDLMARMVDGVMRDLKLTPEQQERAPEIVRHNLAMITAGRAA